MKVSFSYVLIFICFVVPRSYYIYQLNEKQVNKQENIIKGGDASHYFSIAKNLHEQFVYAEYPNVKPTQSATWRPPFWPLVLSVLMLFSLSPLFLISLKCLTELLIILMAFSIFKREFKNKWLVTLIFCFLVAEPYYIKYSITFLSESLTAVILTLYTILILSKKLNNKLFWLISVLAVFSIYTHPIVIFYVLSTFALFVYTNFMSFKFNTSIAIGVLIIGFLIWPIRNAITFNVFPYITVSQGAVFSKGWNEKVIDNFNNVDGDLADETINLKYLRPIDAAALNYVERSSRYNNATKVFVFSQDLSTLIKIAWTKIKSNFTPYPQKQKPGTLEVLATIYRILFLIALVQSLYIVFFKTSNEYFKVATIVILVYLSQVLMSVVFYTGLRFNSVYHLILLLSFILFNKKLFVFPKRLFTKLI